ncbi:MAG: ABC transporter substrate-binding protein [Bacteroidota bacterium]|nr:ABC transporter substrate-binding protein [Bacteroidota bacterium]
MKQFFIFIWFFTSLLFSQEVEVYFNQVAENNFLLGMRQYAQKDFKTALQSFEQSKLSFPMNHRITAAMIMEAKTLYALKEYELATEVCDSLVNQFPSSLYMEDVLFTRGMCYYNQTLYEKTYREMENVVLVAQQRLNKEHSIKVIEHLATEFFSIPQIDSLLDVSTNEEIKNVLMVVQSERLFQNGNIDEAKDLIDKFNPNIAEQRLIFRINRLKSRIEKGNAVRIGVLLPLLSSTSVETREKKIALEVLEGVQLAISDYEERTVPGQVTVELDIKDSEKDSAKILSIISEWSVNNNLVGIVGPVFSNETIHAAKTSQAFSIPIISPTATDEGISSIGQFVFQANSTNGSRGKVLAQYAVNILGAKNIAILGSAQPYTSLQADSFIVEAKRLGARIVIDRRYKKGESDLRSYVRAIRDAAANLQPEYIVALRGKAETTEITRRLVSLGIRFSLIDSIIARGASLNLTAIFGDSAQKVADQLKLTVKRVIPYLDSLQYPVTSIDVVYCPISNSHEIGVLSSQLTFYNIKATVLGSGDWYDANELDLNKRYTNGIIFGSDRWVDRNEQTNRIFTKYAQRYGRTMSENVMFGYDVMTLIIRQFKDGALTREQLAEALKNVTEFTGIRNTISLTKDRVNSSMHILEYKNGVVSKLQTFSYQ